MVDSNKKVWRFNYILMVRIMALFKNDEAKSLLRELKIPCNLVDRKGNTLVHYALKYRNSEMMEHLIEIGHDSDLRHEDGFALLTSAINNEDISSIRVLLKFNTNIYSIQQDNMSFLKVTVYRRLVESEPTYLNQISHSIFDLFIDRINRDFLTNNRKLPPQLCDAENLIKLAIVAYGDLEIAKFILENNYSIDYFVPGTGRTALHWAIIFGKIENAKLLMDHGANIGLLHGTRNTPLYYYTYNFERIDDQSEILKILLKVECDHKRNLRQLLFLGSKKTVRLLLESNLDVVSMVFEDDKSLLHILMGNKNFDDFDFFAKLITKIDLNSPSNDTTPLMDAVRSRCIKKVKFLLQHGANVNWISPNRCNTAVFGVCSSYFSRYEIDREPLAEIIELLLQYGADIQIILFNERTILNVIRCTDQTQLVAEMIMAHLALLESYNHALLIDRIRIGIKSDPILNIFFDLCVRDIEELKGIKVHEAITLWSLLTEKVEKIAFYARNQQFVLEFNCLMKNNTHIQPYYLNTLQKKVTQALDRIELDRQAASVIEILIGICSDVYYVIIYKIIRYLNVQDLQKLCKVNNINPNFLLGIYAAFE